MTYKRTEFPHSLPPWKRVKVRKHIPLLCGDLKSVISMAYRSDSHVLHVHRRILPEFLVRNGSELVRFDSVSGDKSMRLLRDGISWVIIVKH